MAAQGGGPSWHRSYVGPALRAGPARGRGAAEAAAWGAEQVDGLCLKGPEGHAEKPRLFHSWKDKERGTGAGKTWRQRMTRARLRKGVEEDGEKGALIRL